MGSSASRIDGPHDERAGDGHALALAARELVGLVRHAVGRGPTISSAPPRLASRSSLGDARVDERQLDVVEGGGARQQVEGLEDEADLAVADGGQLVVVHLRDDLARAGRSCPRLGVSRQPMRFMRVDLPEPDGPITATYSLGAIVKLTPRRAWISSAAHHVGAPEVLGAG